MSLSGPPRPKNTYCEPVINFYNTYIPRAYIIPAAGNRFVFLKLKIKTFVTRDLYLNNGIHE